MVMAADNKDVVLNGKEFLKIQKAKLLKHPLFYDPYIVNISSVSFFDISQAKIFALLYYPHILRTRLYQANALGITPDENIQFVLSEIIYDEYGLGDPTKSHAQLYRNFMCALGIRNEEMIKQNIIPELKSYIETMMNLTQGKNWLSAVAAVGVASEHPIPKYYSLLLKGLRKIPGIKEEDLELFTGHMVLDIEHSKKIEQALLPYLDDIDNQNEFIDGININMDARRQLHSGLNRAIFS